MTELPALHGGPTRVNTRTSHWHWPLSLSLHHIELYMKGKNIQQEMRLSVKGYRSECGADWRLIDTLPAPHPDLSLASSLNPPASHDSKHHGAAGTRNHLCRNSQIGSWFTILPICP